MPSRFNRRKAVAPVDPSVLRWAGQRGRGQDDRKSGPRGPDLSRVAKVRPFFSCRERRCRGGLKVKEAGLDPTRAQTNRRTNGWTCRSLAKDVHDRRGCCQQAPPLFSLQRALAAS